MYHFFLFFVFVLFFVVVVVVVVVCFFLFFFQGNIKASLTFAVCRANAISSKSLYGLEIILPKNKECCKDV